MSSEGTSLEDIETGNIQHSADDAVMNAILSDMNGVEDQQHQQPQQPPMYIPPPVQQPMQPPPQFQVQQAQQAQYFQQPDPFPSMTAAQSIYEPVYEPAAATAQQQQHQQAPQQAPQQAEQYLKKNSWSTVFDQLRDPLIVGLLVCLFSLPALHTWLSRRMSWAYKVGGSLSWIGFLLQFLLVAGIFATYRQITVVMGVA